MPSPSTLAAFSLASLLFVLFPGPAMLFLVARGVAGGPRVGALSALGVETANAVYVAATALGLTALLAASSVAIGVVLDVGYGVFGGLARARIARSGRAHRRGRLGVGLTYIGLGGLSAATGHRPA